MSDPRLLPASVEIQSVAGAEGEHGGVNARAPRFRQNQEGARSATDGGRRQQWLVGRRRQQLGLALRTSEKVLQARTQRISARFGKFLQGSVDEDALIRWDIESPEFAERDEAESCLVSIRIAMKI